jgi:hypothetical protein
MVMMGVFVRHSPDVSDGEKERETLISTERAEGVSGLKF